MDMGSTTSHRFNLAQLQGDSLTMLAPCVLAIGYTWLIVVTGMVDSFVPLASWIGSSVLAFSATASFALRHRSPRLASDIFVMGTLIGAGATLTLLPRVHAYYLFLLPILFASVLLGTPSLVATSMLAIATIWLYGGGGAVASPIELLYPTGVILLVTAAAWLSARSLNTALNWVWQGYNLAQESARLARQRRAELRRALDALTEATGRLERTNRELVAARHDAVEARTLQEQFVANVSHELRTPLNLVVGFAEMLYLSPESYDGVGWTPDLVEDIGAMFRAGRQLQNLISDVLDLSRIHAARLPTFREQTDLAELVHETVEAMAPLFRQRGLAYEVAVPDTLPALFVDRTRIRQVLINLLNNALRFTDAGEISVSATLGPDAVIVSVHDTGIGIPSDQLEHIFEQFRQVDASLSRRGGVGLGLAISREFVELHGGRMWVESVEHQGSTFSFTLPLPERASDTIPLLHIPDRRQADLSAAPVLVVDPDPTVAQMLSRYLGDRRTLAIETVDEAEAYVELEHPAAVIVNQTPGSSPEDWLGTLGPATDRWGVPVVRCAIPSPSWLARALGIRACLTKPVSREVLLHAIDHHLPQPGAILVVDDDPGFVSLVVRMLQGCDRATRVFTAYRGEEALQVIREQSPALVLLDLFMPEMDGFEVLDRLHAEEMQDRPAVIAVTATSYAEETLRRGKGLYSVTQSASFSAEQLTELLSATLRIVHPNYASDDAWPPASQ